MSIDEDMANYVLYIENLRVKIRVFKPLSCVYYICKPMNIFFHSMLESRFIYVLKHFVIYVKLVVLFIM